MPSRSVHGLAGKAPVEIVEAGCTGCVFEGTPRSSPRLPADAARVDAEDIREGSRSLPPPLQTQGCHELPRTGQPIPAPPALKVGQRDPEQLGSFPSLDM